MQNWFYQDWIDILMTRQISDTVIHNGIEHYTTIGALLSYFSLSGKPFPQLQLTSTACWKRYLEKCEVVGERLYLVELHGLLKDGRNFNLEAAFPGYPNRVFAHWFSGTIQLFQGKQLQKDPESYPRDFERKTFLRLKKGVVLERYTRRNLPHKNNLSDGNVIQFSQDAKNLK